VNWTGDQNFERGLSALQAGNLNEAERLLQAVTHAQPTHIRALNLLGVVLGRLGRYAEAMASYDRALASAPNSAEAWYGRGMTLLAIGRPLEAIASFDNVLAAKPDFTQVHLLRAKLLADLGRREAALAGIENLLALAPRLAEAWLGRSNILFEAGRYEEALSAADQAVASKPDLAEAWHARGNALNELNRHDEALAAYEKALSVSPNFAGAWHGRGNALKELKRYDEALSAYDKALALAPGMAEAWLGRGNVLNMFKRCKEALVAFDRADAAISNLAEVWLGRGNSLCELNRYHDAWIAYEKALALNRDLAQAWFGSGNVLVQLKEHDKALAAFDRALSLKPNLKYAKGEWIHAKLQLSDWANLDAAISELVEAVKANEPVTVPFQFLGISSSPADQLQCTKRVMADQPSFPTVWRGEVYAHDRIRIGYFSADFCTHPVGQLAVGLFEAHDKSRFETIAISFGPDDGSDLRRRIKWAFEDFIDVREMSDSEIAALIHRREIDIVIDLTGLTRYNRFSVLSRRVAPVQVNFLGYPGTMGADCMDYIIADRTIIPKEHFQYYSEQVVWLPDTYQARDSKIVVPERRPSRAECGLPESAFVFCCFNNTYKVTPEIFDIWMRLLGATANGVLWLIGTNTTAETNLRREAERRGISPGRLIFAPKMLLADHFARSAHADLFLDTMAYNAHTTGSDALWAGVPLLTCLGSTFAARVGASLVRAVGLDELVTASLQDYEALALKVANDPSYLRALRDRLARNRKTHPLFDTARFARHIEAAYTAMWQRSQRGEAPRAFAVDPMAELK
jgi:protein O-GlcNAc transferase